MRAVGDGSFWQRAVEGTTDGPGSSPTRGRASAPVSPPSPASPRKARSVVVGVTADPRRASRSISRAAVEALAARRRAALMDGRRPRRPGASALQAIEGASAQLTAHVFHTRVFRAQCKHARQERRAAPHPDMCRINARRRVENNYDVRILTSGRKSLFAGHPPASSEAILKVEREWRLRPAAPQAREVRPARQARRPGCEELAVRIRRKCRSGSAPPAELPRWSAEARLPSWGRRQGTFARCLGLPRAWQRPQVPAAPERLSGPPTPRSGKQKSEWRVGKRRKKQTREESCRRISEA